MTLDPVQLVGLLGLAALVGWAVGGAQGIALAERRRARDRVDVERVLRCREQQEARRG